MQRSLLLLLLMGQCSLFTCHLYKYHFVNMNESWHGARAYCTQKYTDLATLYGKTDISRLRHSANNQDKAVWIGLYNKPDADKPEWRWSWSRSGEEYNTDQAEWNKSNKQPKNEKGDEYCVAVRTYGDRWWDDSCTVSYKFICYNEKSSSNKFFVSQEEKTWLDAQKYCRENHTDLVSGVGNLKSKKLTDQVKHGQYYWIGLFRDIWRWSDGSSSIFRPWNHSFPDGQPREKKCAALDEDGSWMTDDCDSGKPFFCYEDNVILIEENKTWEEAIDHCRENYKDLISITDPGQQRWVQERAKKASSSHVWLGLHYTCVLDVWFWVTNERLIYQNWASDVETDDCDMSGAMETRGEHKWAKEKDVRKFNFFCSKF